MRNKESNKSVKNLLLNNKAICNYVYNTDGFAIGVVIAIPGQGKHHPRIGWALFDEVLTKTVTYTKASDIPFIKEKLTTLFVESPVTAKLDASINLATTIKDLLNYKITPKKVKFLKDREAKYDLFELAIKRANYQSWDFYSCREEDPNEPRVTQKLADIRNNIVQYYRVNDLKHIEGFGDLLTLRAGEEIIEENFELANAIRHSVRAMEYRAFKYYKDSDKKENWINGI